MKLLTRTAAFLLLFCSFQVVLSAQAADRWQQKAVYEMNIDFDVNNHQFTGTQQLKYTNNSPDTLNRIFYHLYFNAFQSGSMMDVRSRSLPDADSRVADRISELSTGEMGYLRVNSLQLNGQPVQFEEVGTILEVNLPQGILPGATVVLDMDFNGQVPLQIRRSGRDNSEGIAYSMSQWYPKLCEYDYQGWHANPYIAREFHGVWGDFDVKIRIDKEFTIGATGYLQNPDEIGHGYTDKEVKPKADKNDKLTWHFVAPNVHDFVWAADPDYTHTKLERKDGTVLHFFFQENSKTQGPWSQLPEIMDQAFDFINARYGQYPYQQYSFIQGGDGGMEYPMATLITGERSLGSLVGVSIHELMHSWYQMILGTNESLYAWMDEGFTSFASAEVTNYLKKIGALPGQVMPNPSIGSYKGYANLVESGLEEPMTTHADHFVTNFAYGQAAYSKGAVFMKQLEYIIGEEALSRGLLRYFNTWKFRHPNPNDFIRVMEKESGLELDWYKEYFVQTTKTIDYAIESAEQDPNDRKKSRIKLSRLGLMPMPVDVQVTFRNGQQETYTIPLRIMRGAKTQDGDRYLKVAADWPWVNPEYVLEVDARLKDIAILEIDPSGRLADLNAENNVFTVK